MEDDKIQDGVYKVQLQRYFWVVFNLRVDLSKEVFSQKDDFSAFMVVPPELDEGIAIAAFVKKWGITIYQHLEPIAENINRNKEQSRPKGLYVFAHRGGDESDKQYLNRSYNTGILTGRPFANALEYLLMTGFHKFTKGYFMDRKGWTRFSSLWSDGNLVGGQFIRSKDELRLRRGFPGSCKPNCGFRELLFT